MRRHVRSALRRLTRVIRANAAWRPRCHNRSGVTSIRRRNARTVDPSESAVRRALVIYLKTQSQLADEASRLGRPEAATAVLHRQHRRQLEEGTEES